MAFEFFPMTDYAKEETERVLRELPTLETGDFRFAFMPDYHYKYIREMRTSFSNIIHMLNALNENEKIEFFCLGGDNVGNYPPSKEEHIDMMSDLAMYFLTRTFLSSPYRAITTTIASTAESRPTARSAAPKPSFRTTFSTISSLLSMRRSKISTSRTKKRFTAISIFRAPMRA